MVRDANLGKRIKTKTLRLGSYRNSENYALRVDHCMVLQATGRLGLLSLAMGLPNSAGGVTTQSARTKALKGCSPLCEYRC